MSVKELKESYDMQMKPKELLAKVENSIKKTRTAFDTLGALDKENITCDSFLKVLAVILAELTNDFRHLCFPQQVSTDKSLRDAAQEAENILTEFRLQMNMNQDIFSKLQILEAKNIKLEPQWKRFLEMLITKGKRNALHLPKETQEQVKALQNKISAKCIDFQKNLNEVTTVLEFTKEELDGMPEDFISELEKSPDTGKLKVTLKYPHYFPIMEKAKNPETRKRLLFAFNTVCLEENVPLLEEVITLRHENAQLLGYPTHASYKTAICHSKNPKNVQDFQSKLGAKLKPLWAKERELMLKIKEKECSDLGIPFDGTINDFDLSYYSNKVLEIYYNVDMHKVSEYFPFPVVKKGLIHIYQKIFGLTFREVPNPNAWHPDVELLSVEDAANGNLIGYIFLDLFPREGKYGHAANFPLQNRYVKDGDVQLPVVAIVTNFTKPTATKPTLLTHKEVTTFFHEFGHAIHNSCFNNDIGMLNDLYEIDLNFLELPSQMLENWVWEEESLKLISEHYSDKSPMPQDLMDALLKIRVVNAGLVNLKSLVLSTADQKIHSLSKADTKSVYHKIYEELLGIKPLKETNFMARFAHLTHEYDAGYYSYHWSKVFSIDLFEECFKNGNILNPEVGLEYRQKVLAVGCARSVDEILFDILGREPSDKAFLAELGIEV